MVDPLSVSASAAGVISLGLTVCQGLVAYYAPFAAYSSETESLIQKLNGLEAIMDVLQCKLDEINLLPDCRLAVSVKLVDDRIKECSGGLQRLYDTLNKVRGLDATGATKRKGWSYAQALYPLRRGTLMGLADVVLSLQSNLDAALQVLVLAISKQVHEQTSLTLLVSQSIAAKTLDIPKALSRLEDGQQHILQTVFDIQQSQERTLGSLATSLETSLATTGSTTHPRLTASQRISQLIPSRKGPTYRTLSGISNKGGPCLCGRAKKAKSQWWSLAFFGQTHEFGCPMYLERDLTTFLKGRVVVLGDSSGFCITFSIDAIRDGAGFSINPVLNFRPVVPNISAPAFAAVRQGLMEARDKSVTGDPFDRTLLQLRQLFQEGKASPRDALPDGSTLLHFAIRWVMEIPLDCMPDYRKFLDELVRSYHVPLNEMAGYRPLALGQMESQTVLDKLLSARHFHWPHTDVPIERLVEIRHILSNLISHGGLITARSSMEPPQSEPLLWDAHSSLVRYCVNHLVLPAMAHEWHQDELPFPEIEIAILQQSEPYLEMLLSNQTSNNFLGSSSPLLAAVAWPRGLEMILKVYQPTCLPQVLEQAIMSRQAESIRILLEAGQCPISDWAVHLAAVYHYDEHVFRTIANGLAKQRRFLLRRALEYLPPEHLRELGIYHGSTLLDSLADRVSRDLREHTGELTPGLPSCDNYYPGSSVYHIIGCNTHAADILFDSGFTTVTEPDGWGLSAFFQLHPPNTVHHSAMFQGQAFTSSLIEFLNMCEWFQNKGFSVNTPCPATPLLPVHHIAYCIGQSISRTLGARRGCLPDNALELTIRRVAKDWIEVFSRHSTLIRQVLKDDQPRDSCSCACSINGCLPSSIIIKESIYDLRSETLCGDLLANILDFQHLSDATSAKAMDDALTPAVLRVCTFEGLGLRHTCRFHNPRNHTIGRVKWDDITEVQAEDRLLVGRLEELLLEFESKYQELGVSLPNFLTGYWKTRMQEIKAEDQIFDEMEARKMAEVGVIVDRA